LSAVSEITYPLIGPRCNQRLTEAVAGSTDFSLKPRQNLH